MNNITQRTWLLATLLAFLASTTIWAVWVGHYGWATAFAAWAIFTALVAKYDFLDRNWFLIGFTVLFTVCAVGTYIGGELAFSILFFCFSLAFLIVTIIGWKTNYQQKRSQAADISRLNIIVIGLLILASAVSMWLNSITFVLVSTSAVVGMILAMLTPTKENQTLTRD